MDSAQSLTGSSPTRAQPLERFRSQRGGRSGSPPGSHFWTCCLLSPPWTSPFSQHLGGASGCCFPPSRRQGAELGVDTLGEGSCSVNYGAVERLNFVSPGPANGEILSTWTGGARNLPPHKKMFIGICFPFHLSHILTSFSSFSHSDLLCLGEARIHRRG